MNNSTETSFNISSSELLNISDENYISNTNNPTNSKKSQVSSSKVSSSRNVDSGQYEHSSTYDNTNNSRKVPTLIPRQRLAIPQKYINSNGNFGKNNGLVLEVEARQTIGTENKPLVQWDSDESEEELSFFPKHKQKSTLNDNMSVENMSLSGDDDDDEDLHLTPPKSKSMSGCPCDPRLLIESKWLRTTTHLSHSSSSSSFRDDSHRNDKSCIIS